MKLTAIVAATDLSDQAVPAAKWAHELAQRTHAKVIAGHVFELGFDSWWHSKYEALMDDEKRAAAVAATAKWFEDAVGAPPTAAELKVDHCSNGLTKIVQEHHADLLVMSPSSKSRLMKTLVGSRVHELASRPPCAVAIVKAEDALTDGAKVAVATDFSPPSERAIRFAAGMAAVTGCLLEIVTVAHQPSSPALPNLFDGVAADLPQLIRQRLEGYVAGVLGPDHGALLTVLTGDPVHDALYDYAEAANLALLVLGRTGHRSVVGDLLGSVPRTLINRLPCTIVVTPADPEVPGAPV